MNEWETCIDEWAERLRVSRQETADAQATIADLQGQLKALNSATDNAIASMRKTAQEAESRAIQVEQRVAQLESWRDGVVKAFVEAPLEWSPDLGAQHIPSSLPQIFKNMKDYADRLTTLQADHARVLGLVQEIKEAFDGDVHQCERCGEADPLTTFDIYKTVCEAASLPAQPAQGEEALIDRIAHINDGCECRFCKPQPAQGGAKCVWVDDGGGTYATGCKEYFQVYAESEEAPQWVKFCCYCGKSVEHFADTEGETRA